jgi:uncharacterized 2Fe-2S/4Fe-4S cluster protein (DUF4445 family)
MTEQNPLIVFTPSGKRGRFAKGTPVLQAARALGVDIDSVCGGRAICGRCQITVGEGEFAKHGITSRAGHVSRNSRKVEQRYDKLRGLAAGRRLSCQTKIMGDLVIDVPPESQVHKQVVRKEADTRAIELDPATHLCFIEVEEPDMHKPSSDLERVYKALKDQWGVENVTCDLSIIADLQKTLRKGEWKITCAVYSRAPGGGNRLVPSGRASMTRLSALAIDVGSTTIAAHLTNLSTGEVVASAGLMNPQIRFGEDLMSRVSYVMMNPGGEKEMTGHPRQRCNSWRKKWRSRASNAHDILEVVLVGNPVMHHLFLGIDPTELGGAPFALATGLPVTFRPARSTSSSIPAPGPMCCPASPAMWARIRRAWCCPKRRTRRTRSCWR